MSAAAVMEIYLVRHGETDWNRAQRLQGTIDTSLNRIGVAQAHQLADWFRAQGVSAVVTSPLARARSTAQATLLSEIDHGSWAGLTIPTIARTSPGAVIKSQIQPEALGISGGETIAAAFCRASTALQRLTAATAAAPIVVVSHGVVNALLMCAALGNAPAHMDQYTQPNGCTYRLRFRRRALVDVECTRPVAFLPAVARHCSVPGRATS